jgi:hypothetical protein
VPGGSEPPGGRGREQGLGEAADLLGRVKLLGAQAGDPRRGEHTRPGVAAAEYGPRDYPRSADATAGRVQEAPLSLARGLAACVEFAEAVGEESSLGLIGDQHERLGVGQARGVGAVQAAQELGPRRGQVVIAG